MSENAAARAVRGRGTRLGSGNAIPAGVRCGGSRLMSENAAAPAVRGRESRLVSENDALGGAPCDGSRLMSGNVAAGGVRRRESRVVSENVTPAGGWCCGSRLGSESGHPGASGFRVFVLGLGEFRSGEDLVQSVGAEDAAGPGFQLAAGRGADPLLDIGRNVAEFDVEQLEQGGGSSSCFSSCFAFGAE